MRLHFTLGYHPEGDRQMEHANQVLEQYLQVYTNYQQDDWVTLLPMAKFTYNNAMNMTTGVSPFFTNKGYHPEFTVDPQVKTSLAEAQAFMVDLECIQVDLKENITQAQERYQKNADKHRAEAPKLNISDQAYVKVKFFRTRQPSKKLLEKNLGPYDIIGKGHGMTSLLSFLISFPLCLCPAPSPSPSDPIQPHPPAFCHLHSNSEAYSCNYAMSALGLALD